MIRHINGQYWYCCPFCKKALFPVRERTRVQSLLYRCKACKHDIEINIPSIKSQEP